MVWVVITYYNRLAQLRRTLATIKSRVPFQLLVVDDASDPPLILDESVRVLRVHPEQKHWINNEPPYNMGVAYALSRGAQTLVTQVAECYHVGDVIAHAVSTVTDGNYISYSCLSLDAQTPHHSLVDPGVLQRRAGRECMGWYNHPVYRPAALDFCAALTRKTALQLNGYDERFSGGIGRSDRHLVERVRLLDKKILIPTDPFVVHQHHERPSHTRANIAQNKGLYERLKPFSARAVHIFTPDFDYEGCTD